MSFDSFFIQFFMQSFKQHINYVLQDIYSEVEIRYFFYDILEKITGFSRTQLMANVDIELSENQTADAENFVERLKNNEPIQYVLGETEFYGLKFKVTPSVLIPRPETEELIDLPPNPLNGELLDIGTGSGCIAISFKKKFPDLNVSAMDVSPEALKVAKENAILNGVEINFIQADILNLNTLGKKYDVIVSNPPYIPESDKKEMELNVLDYEPSLALFVPDYDALVFYRKIAELGRTYLNRDGKLYFEIHHQQAENIKKLLASYGYTDIQIKKDISGNDRMVRCRL